ncbi:hypothetical protein [Saccharibacillus sacchari]|uniref:hypothetical protein n=1 Tax=Saccharibacillus sacchari TaxID=456493 RepID=UPI0012EB3243|nr:hypothetical protein [Saccharibacillus sacchari]
MKKMISKWIFTSLAGLVVSSALLGNVQVSSNDTSESQKVISPSITLKGPGGGGIGSF